MVSVIIPRCGHVTRPQGPHQSGGGGGGGAAPENVMMVVVPGYYSRGYITQYLLHCPPDDGVLFPDPPASPEMDK